MGRAVIEALGAMSEHAYSASLFWQELHGPAEFAKVAGPLLLVGACLIWGARTRAWSALSGLVGAVLLAAGQITHTFVASVNYVAMPYPQPAADQNPWLLFVYLYGHRFGSLILGLSVAWYFAKKQHVA